MVIAMREAGIEPSDIVHINAHATSTPLGDIAEGLMIHATLGAAADRVVVTSTKSMTGHLLGGAGALESIATVLALHDRVVPPTINLDDRDPKVDLDIATKARDLPQGDIAAMNNSFGFGGANVAVAFGSHS
jgi:3-oxoacyl-[acyl-carrier-protein] synthase II